MLNSQLLKPTLRKNVVFIIASVGVLILLFAGANVHAAQFASGETVTVDESLENLHISGSQITVDADMSKDLIAAASLLTVNGSIERNLIAGAAQLYINSEEIGGSVRIAGGEVILDGVTISEDLIIIGGDISVKNSTIKGDLVVLAGTLKISDSTINGNGYITYSEYSGDDLNEIVTGDLQIQENKTTLEQQERNAGNSAFIASGYALRGEISIVIATLILVVFLGRRNRLAVNSIKFDGQIVVDFFIGLGTYLLGGIIFVLFGIFAIIPFVGTVALTPMILTATSIMLLFAVFSRLYFVVYLANLGKNTFNLSLSIRNVVLITLGIWIVLIFVGLIPVIGWLLNSILGILMLANTGFVLRSLFKAVNNYLRPLPNTESDVQVKSNSKDS